MGIAVLLKQVPDTTAKISVSGGRVDESAVSKWSMSPYDEYALESALQLKEAGGGEVVAITCGPARAAKMLTDAAAVGADSLLHVLVDDLSTLDSTQMQAILAAAVARAGSDIVFCGKQAADTNAGSTGPGVAHLLDASCVTMVSEVTSDGGSITAMRASAGGNERLSPGDLGVDTGGSSVSTEGHTPPLEKPPGQQFEGAESVAEVVGKLRDEANVI